MAFEFKFPDVGEGITEGTLVEWKVDKGSKVKVDQSVASVETDKAVVDIPCPVSGTVNELLGEKGDTLNVGDVIMKIETDDDNQSSEESQKEETQTQNTQAPSSSDTDSHSPETDSHPQDQSQENTSQKIDDDTTPSKSSDILAMPGVVHEAKKRGIDLTKIKPSGKHGQIIFDDLSQQEGENTSTDELSKEEKKTTEDKQKQASSSTDTDSQSQQTDSQSQEVTSVSQDVVATLAVKKLARELDVDINFVVGTGENGRITAQDVQRAKESKDKLKSGENKTQDSTSSMETQPTRDTNIGSTETEKTSQTQTQDTQQTHALSTETDSSSTQTGSQSLKLEGVRKVIASKMVESLSKAAQVTISDEIEVSKLVEIREREKEKLKEENVKLSYLPFIIKAVKHASKKYPHFNARFDDEKQQLDIYSDINMGVAVDTQKGLMVPVIKKAQELSIVDIAKSIMDLADKAKNSKLTQDEMKNSTFTISSIGSITGQTFTPILNYPEPAILGVGRIVEKPVCKDGEVVPGKTMTLSLTVDHRVIDGADAARFLKDVMTLLQDPDLLLMEA